MSNDRPFYQTLPPVRKELYKEFVSKHGTQPTTLAELDEVAQVLHTCGVLLAAVSEEVPHVAAS